MRHAPYFAIMFAIIIALLGIAIEGIAGATTYDPQDRGCVKYGKRGQSRRGRMPWNTEKLTSGTMPQVVAKGAI